MRTTIEVPRLLWSWFRDYEGQLDSVVAHNYSMFELSYNDGIALMFDARQGIVWVHNGGCSRYISRGYCIDGERIVDTSGDKLLRVGFEPEKIVLGRRTAVLASQKQTLIIERLPPSKLLSVKNSDTIFSSDPYTLAVYAKKRRDHVLYVDSIHGFLVERLPIQPRGLRARGGCVIVEFSNSSIVSNGAFTTKLVIRDVEPLASNVKACILAVKASGGYIVAVVHNTGEFEPIDHCRSKPRLAYQDERLVIYTCDNMLKMFSYESHGVKTLGECEGGECIATPVYTLIREDNLLVTEYNEAILAIPDSWVLTAYRDILVLASQYGVYAIDFSNNDSITIEAAEGENAPITLTIEPRGYKLHRINIDGNIILEKLEVKGGYARAQLTPSSLSKVTRLKLNVMLSPPLSIETNVTLEIPLPKIHANLVHIRLEDPVSAVEVTYGDSIARLEKGREFLLIIDVEPRWEKALRNAKLIVKTAGGEIEIPFRPRMVVSLEDSPDDILVASQDVTLRLPVDTVNDSRLEHVQTLAPRLLGIDFVNIDEIILNLEVEDTATPFIDGLPCGEVDRGIYACRVPKPLENHELKVCLDYNETMICSIIDWGWVATFIKDHLPEHVAVKLPDTLVVNVNSPVLTLNIEVDKPTILRIEAGELKETRYVGSTAQPLHVGLWGLDKPTELTVKVLTRRGIREYKSLVIPVERPEALALRVGDKLFVAIKNAYLIHRGVKSGFIVLNARELGRVNVVTRCGDSISIKILELRRLLEQAVRVANTISALVSQHAYHI